MSITAAAAGGALKLMTQWPVEQWQLSTPDLLTYLFASSSAETNSGTVYVNIRPYSPIRQNKQTSKQTTRKIEKKH